MVSKYEDVIPKEVVFIVFLALVSLNTCNDGSINTLNVVRMNDDDKIELPVKE